MTDVEIQINLEASSVEIEQTKVVEKLPSNHLDNRLENKIQLQVQSQHIEDKSIQELKEQSIIQELKRLGKLCQSDARPSISIVRADLERLLQKLEESE